MCFFFFKQKTAYEMRISDWSSDVCSSDLVDIDGLLRHFGQEPGFWDDLLARADAFGAGLVLFYGLRYATKLFGTPVPESVGRRVRRWRPVPPVVALMDWLVIRSLSAYRSDEHTSELQSLMRISYAVFCLTQK